MTFLLRLIGASLLLAVPCALLPRDWMAATHVWLGLGEFPAGPIVEYLARSTALLYGLHGVVLWTAASDPRRYAPLLVIVGGVHVLLAPAMFLVDFGAGMPAYWTWMEGPMVLPLSLALFVGARALVRHDDRASPSRG